MADSLLSHRHPHDHRHCTPRRQLVSIRKASGDDPEYVVNLDERRPVVVAAIRDVEDERHDTALRCLQERTLSVAAVEEEKRPQQDTGLHQAPPRRPEVGFPQPTFSRRPQTDFGAFSLGPFNPFYAERRQEPAFGQPQVSSDGSVLGFSQPIPASRRSRRVSGSACVRPCGMRLSFQNSPTSSAIPERRQDAGVLQDSSQQALGFPRVAVCRRHRQEAGPPSSTRPFATYASTQMALEHPPSSSNIRPDGYY